jgi:hypothetical protein
VKKSAIFAKIRKKAFFLTSSGTLPAKEAAAAASSNIQ